MQHLLLAAAPSMRFDEQTRHSVLRPCRKRQRVVCAVQSFYTLRNSLDNPDQRLTADIASFGSSLAEAVASMAAAPLRAAAYAWLAAAAFGSWRPVGAAATFFAAGALLQR